MTSELSPRYTQADHEFRDDDEYAASKYRLTLKWLRKAGARGVMYHIGCGAGLFNEDAVHAGFAVEAFEPDPRAFRRALANRPAASCSVHQLGIEGIVGDEVADVIVMHDVLEHLADDHDAVERLHRLLKPDGILILSVPAMQWLFGYHDEQLGHFRRYRKRSLRTVVQPRFDIRRIRYFGASMIPLTLWFSRWRRRPYPTSTAGGDGLVARAFRTLCRAEERFPGPVGTSLLCEARRSARS